MILALRAVALTLALALAQAAGLGPGRVALAQNLRPVPLANAHVVDQTGTLSVEQRASLESQLTAFEARKGSQIAVVIVPTTAPESIEQYALRLVEQWKLGRKNVDDGALLVVAKDDRALRIEVGYGLEGVLPDALAARIIDEVIAPRFREQDFAGGINEGVQRMMAVIDGEPLPPPRDGGNDTGAPAWLALMPVFMLVMLLVAGVARALLGRTRASLVTGGLAALTAFWFVGWGVALMVGAAVAIMTFTGAVQLLRGLGGARSQGSGGGFRGGGGGFGGGGASGRW